jgi:hypothetical protein
MLFAAIADVGSWHICDISTSLMAFRFQGKSGRAADITAKTDSDRCC